MYDKLQLQPEYEINPDELQLIQKVGEGEFGSVHRGRWNKTTVAIKTLRRSDAVALGDFRQAPEAHAFSQQLLHAMARDSTCILPSHIAATSPFSRGIFSTQDTWAKKVSTGDCSLPMISPRPSNVLGMAEENKNIGGNQSVACYK